MNSNNYIKSMLFGFMLGDGWISEVQPKENGTIYFQPGFSGDIPSLTKVKQDLIHLYGEIGKATIRHLATSSPKYHIEGTTTQMTVNTAVANEFIKMGMPTGKRVEKDWSIPKWIVNGSKETKKAFLSGFYAAEGYTPAFQRNNKTLKTMGFNFHRRKEREENFHIVIEQFANILESLAIEFTIHYKEVFTKAENIVVEFRFKNSHENILHSLRTLDLRYAVDKQKEIDSVLSYYEYKDEKLKELQEAMTMAHEGKLKPSDIAKLYNISVNTVQGWKSKNKKVAKTPKTIITYEAFKQNLSPLRENVIE